MPGSSQGAGAPQARVVLRPVGTPLPLGFLGLSMATAVFSALQLGWLAPDQGRVVGLVVLVFSVPLQLLGAVMGFGARDPVAGTGMAVLAGTWAVAGTVTLTTPPGTSSPGLGVALVVSAVALLLPAVAGASKLVAAAVMGLASLRFAVTAVAHLTGDGAWETAAGTVGLVLVAVALYAAAAFELEGVHGRAVLPTGRRGKAQVATQGSSREELAGVATEPGVRRQL